MVGKLKLQINGSKEDGHGNFHNLTNHVSLVLEVELKVIEMIKGTIDQDGFPQNMLLEYLMMFQF